MFNFTCMVEINNLGVCEYPKYMFFLFFLYFLSVSMPSILDFTWCRNTVRNKVIHKTYVFSVISRSRTSRFGRNKELVLRVQFLIRYFVFKLIKSFMSICTYKLSFQTRTTIHLEVSILTCQIIDSLQYPGVAGSR
jgi:hypothetical protein